MTFAFDLLEEPWISCVAAGTDAPRQLGIRQTLRDAATLLELVHPSPLVTVATYRLLLAVLHSALRGPRDEAAWAELWEHGSFQGGVIEGYLSQPNVRDRFNLFDEQHPFYQCASLEWDYATSVAALAHELASSANNQTLFDHTVSGLTDMLTPAEAAGYVLAYQAFSPGGLITHRKTEPAYPFKYSDGAPLVKSAVCLVRGSSLFHTLVLNLHRYDPEQGVPFEGGPGDAPAWEREEELRVEERRPRGYLDLLTWQSRRLRLRPARDEDGRVVVREVVKMKGDQFPDGFTLHGKETMVAFTANLKAGQADVPWLPVGFRAERALWRDAHALVEFASTHATDASVLLEARPKQLSWLANLAVQGYLPASDSLPVDFYGIVTDQAKALLWCRDHLALPLAFLGDDHLGQELRADLAQALKLAQDVATVLRTATLLLARLLLAPRSDQLDGHSADEAQARVVADGLGVGRMYWWRLEMPFRTFVASRAAENVDPPHRGAQTVARSREEWRDAVHSAALQAFREACSAMDTSARTLKAVARGEGALQGEIRTRLHDYAALPVAGAA